uniref:Uncharacterized protein n=1 Tax=Arundo donax TaxID=35708 RepID=A0A0A9C8N1_ARUDO
MKFSHPSKFPAARPDPGGSDLNFRSGCNAWRALMPQNDAGPFRLAIRRAEVSALLRFYEP